MLADDQASLLLLLYDLSGGSETVAHDLAGLARRAPVKLAAADVLEAGLRLQAEGLVQLSWPGRRHHQACARLTRVGVEMVQRWRRIDLE